MGIIRNSILASLTLSAAMPVAAQSYYAREQVSVPQSGTPTSSAAWTTGDFSDWNSQCSSTAVRSRSVTCQKDGVPVPDSECTGTKPSSVDGPKSILDGCNYEYRHAFYLASLPTSSGDYSCRNGGIQIVDDIKCYRKGNSNPNGNYYFCQTVEKIDAPDKIQPIIPCVARSDYDTFSYNHEVTYVSGFHFVKLDLLATTLSNSIRNAALEKCKEIKRSNPDAGLCTIKRYYPRPAENATYVEMKVAGVTLTDPTTGPSGSGGSYLPHYSNAAPVMNFTQIKRSDIPDYISEAETSSMCSKFNFISNTQGQKTIVECQ